MGNGPTRIPIWNGNFKSWSPPNIRHPWLWVHCISPFCNHGRAVPIAPWRIRWGDDATAAMRRHFRCGVCGRKGCVFEKPTIDQAGIEAFPASRPLRMAGQRQTGESYEMRDARVLAEYLARFPSGDALGEFRGGPPGRASMCGKFTAMSSWSEVVDFSQPLTDDKRAGANDEPVTLKVMGQLNVIVWDAQEKRRKVVPMRWGFPHPKNWKIPQPIHARSETMDELKTFQRPFLSGQRGIVLMRTFNEGKQVTPSQTEQWTIDPIPDHMTGAAFIFDSFTTPELEASFLACVLVTVPANALIQTLSTEHAAADRMPAFLAPEDWTTWLGENGNDPAAAKAACRTREGVRWTMTKEERAASRAKRSKPTVSDPKGLF